ncbi:hypothetical protein [Phaeobacter sp. C3_T13_0]|uniref:hypothetical protein n=1 Tax=Phaeobacter cretensis TaxID=3342641 RepID=UPI0039BC8EA6
MRFAVHILPRLAMVLALALAMASTGFAHSYDRAEDSPEYAAFLAAGGTLSDLCGDISDPEHTSFANCDACRLVAAALIPSYPVTPGMCSVQRPTVGAAVIVLLRKALLRDPSRPTRAPPAPLTGSL